MANLVLVKIISNENEDKALKAFAHLTGFSEKTLIEEGASANLEALDFGNIVAEIDGDSEKAKSERWLGFDPYYLEGTLELEFYSRGMPRLDILEKWVLQNKASVTIMGLDVGYVGCFYRQYVGGTLTVSRDDNEADMKTYRQDFMGLGDDDED